VAIPRERITPAALSKSGKPEIARVLAGFLGAPKGEIGQSKLSPIDEASLASTLRRVLRPAALIEPDMESYTIRLPVEGFRSRSG
jgi:hypothetical protein